MRCAKSATAAILIFVFCGCGAFAADTAQFVVVIDGTAQMAAQFGHQRKIDWVKTAVPPAVKHLGPYASATLWAFGTKPAKKCRSISQLLAINPADKAAPAMATAMAAVQPRAGRAPVFEAVHSALKALGEDGQKPTTVVLLAGTSDDCGKDICASARALKADYPNAKLSVFGIAMAQSSGDAFTCAAKAMGGSFVALKKGADLGHELQQVLTAPQDAPAVGTGNERKNQDAEKKGVIGSLNSMEMKRRGTEVAGAVSAKSTNLAAENRPVGSGEAPRTETGKAPALLTKAEATRTDAPEKPLGEQKPAEQPKADIRATQVEFEPNVVLSAALTLADTPLDTGVTWRIAKIATSPDGQERISDTPIWTGGGGAAKVKLPEGHYQVEVAYGLASARSDFVVTAAKLQKIVPLEAGMIAAEAFQANNAPKAENVFFTLYHKKPASDREELARSSAGPAVFYVNAGDYALEASAGLAKIEAPVTVKAGKVSSVKMALNVGILDIKAFAVDGVPKLISAWHRLYSSTSAGGGRAVPLISIEGPSAHLQLPAGSYRLETIYGQVQIESLITVVAGQETSKTVILNAGEAKVNLEAKESKDPAVCSIYEAGTDRKTTEPTARSSGTQISFIVKAGLYDIECQRKKGATARKKALVRVIAGETQVTNITE